MKKAGRYEKERQRGNSVNSPEWCESILQWSNSQWCERFQFTQFDQNQHGFDGNTPSDSCIYIHVILPTYQPTFIVQHKNIQRKIIHFNQDHNRKLKVYIFFALKKKKKQINSKEI
jgi:hypothetical protein